LSASRCCPHCHGWFTPSVYRSQQKVCSRPDCQRQRRDEYHRHKRANDAEYRQTTHNSPKKCRKAHPDYLRQYRIRHPEAVVRNRERQRVRDQKPRLAFLQKNRVENYLLMPESLQVQLGSQGFGVSGSFAKSELA
jgi:hypothetical protein